jgi:Tfp pilus assembly protein PilO
MSLNAVEWGIVVFTILVFCMLVSDAIRGLGWRVKSRTALDEAEEILKRSKGEHQP